MKKTIAFGTNKVRTMIRSGICAAAFSILVFSDCVSVVTGESEKISVAANFAARELGPRERIELDLSRPLAAGEGRLAVFIGNIDLTALFEIEERRLGYRPQIVPLTPGEHRLTVYLVAPGGEWRTIAEFPLRIKNEEPAQKASSAAKENFSAADAPTETNTNEDGFELTPNVAINVKGQNQTLTFPREAAPVRNPFTDLAGQSSLQLKISRRGWNLRSQFDLAGSSFRQEALRFGELGARAPQIDLSSYQIELSRGRFKVNLGHVSFGSNRHLVNSFSSRGLTVTIPVGRQNEISLAAVNGTSIVGFDNFVGITRRRHNLLGLTFAREFIKERPQGLRVEFSLLRGSLLPLTNLNEGAVTDAEKSFGFGFKVIGSDKRQRLRYEAGFTRSRFINPADGQLSQGLTLTPLRPALRNARYGEVSFDFLQGLKLWREKKLKLTGTYRHERIDPLFRSIGASTQADRAQHQFEVSASFGEINFVYGNLRDRDNLNNLSSILKTLNRRRNVVFNIALNSFFTPAKPKKWLPVVAYTFDHTHQFGAFLPTNGEFRDPSQIPDQDSFAQSVNAIWQFSERFGLTYRYNRAFQDNRQPGRDRADFESAVNAFAVGLKPSGALDLDFELSQERLKNFEQPRTDRTFRLGTRAAWRTPFLKNSVLSANFSTALAGDAGNTSDSQSAEFDAQWAYKFGFGTKKFKKAEAQFFIRYANRYASAVERVVFANNFNKTQAFNFGLNFNVF